MQESIPASISKHLLMLVFRRPVASQLRPSLLLAVIMVFCSRNRKLTASLSISCALCLLIFTAAGIFSKHIKNEHFLQSL